MSTKIKGSQIQDESIGGNVITDGSITTSDIAADTIGLDDISSVVEDEFYKIKISNLDASPGYISSKLIGKQGVNMVSNSNLEIYGPFIPSSMLGDGSDGSATLDGSSSVSWATRSGSIYTMTRDALCTNLTINSGVTLRVNNYLPYANGTLTNDGTIESKGNDASGASAGATYTNSGSWHSSGGAGGGGAINANGVIGAGSGGASIGGGGGSGGNAGSFIGGSGNTSALVTSAHSSYRNVSFLINRKLSNGYNWASLNGSGGGGGGAGNTANGTGGGGGSGVGLCAVACNTLINNGVIQSVGGKGADGVATSGGSAGGGGGGSAGPVFVFANRVQVTGTIQSIGGSGGAGAGGGSAGTAGSANQVIILKGE